MLDGKPGIKLEAPEDCNPFEFELNVHFIDPEEAPRRKLLDDAGSELRASDGPRSLGRA